MTLCLWQDTQVPGLGRSRCRIPGIEYVADHLGHKNIQNTRIYGQSTISLRQEVFAKLERHPKIVRVA